MRYGSITLQLINLLLIINRIDSNLNKKIILHIVLIVIRQVRVIGKFIILRRLWVRLQKWILNKLCNKMRHFKIIWIIFKTIELCFLRTNKRAMNTKIERKIKWTKCRKSPNKIRGQLNKQKVKRNCTQIWLPGIMGIVLKKNSI